MSGRSFWAGVRIPFSSYESATVHYDNKKGMGLSYDRQNNQNTGLGPSWNGTVFEGKNASARYRYALKQGDFSADASIISSQFAGYVSFAGSVIKTPSRFYFTRAKDSFLEVTAPETKEAHVLVNFHDEGPVGDGLISRFTAPYSNTRVALRTDTVPLNVDPQSISKLILSPRRGVATVKMGASPSQLFDIPLMIGDSPALEGVLSFGEQFVFVDSLGMVSLTEDQWIQIQEIKPVWTDPTGSSHECAVLHKEKIPAIHCKTE